MIEGMDGIIVLKAIESYEYFSIIMGIVLIILGACLTANSLFITKKNIYKSDWIGGILFILLGISLFFSNINGYTEYKVTAKEPGGKYYIDLKIYEITDVDGEIITMRKKENN